MHPVPPFPLDILHKLGIAMPRDISLPAILFIIGLAIFFGTSGGKLFRRLKIPQVVGYIIIGVIMGESLLGVFSVKLVQDMAPISSFALGIIGFMIGGELKAGVFKRYGKSIYIILIWEGVFTFLVVGGFVALYKYLVPGSVPGGLSALRYALALGLLLGALASATAPAATVDVLWEYKSKGVLTTTLIAIVALDDALALMLYGFAGAFAKTLLSSQAQLSVMGVIGLPVLEITKALAIGFANGLLLYFLLRREMDTDKILAYAIGIIILNTGICAVLDVDLILSNMMTGLTLANIDPDGTQEIFSKVARFSPPIYVLFFVLVGARMQLGLLPTMGLLGLIYVSGRTAGKFTGAWLGAIQAKADRAVRKYLGLGLFSQAGVAIGLAIAIEQSFRSTGPAGAAIGIMIINVITATTFIVQIIGPPSVKLAIQLAGEIDRDITEDDLIRSFKVKDLMGEDVPFIPQNYTVGEVMEIIRDSDEFYFPVVDDSEHLVGLIGFSDIRNVLAEKEVDKVVLAVDLAEPVTQFVNPDSPLKTALDIMRNYDLNVLPVVQEIPNEEQPRLIGVLERRNVAKLLKKELRRRTGEQVS